MPRIELPITEQGAEERSGRAAGLSYVLITPARNEAGFIRLTLESVIRQTVRPARWVIVSDGSTDGTDEIVAKYVADHPWIELVRMPERAERHFAGKAWAFNQGYTKVKPLDYQLVGCLDADISFENDYFEFLLEKFSELPRLGVGGTPFAEEGVTYNYQLTSDVHVSGACQLFRRECFESVGGYIPLKCGGVDLVAVTTARMKGWQTKTFTDRVCVHHRKTQGGKHHNLKASFKSGYHDYLMGGHPLWQVCRSVYQMSKQPLVLGGGMLLLGYSWAFVKRAERPITPELVRFRRSEQLQRLKFLIRAK